MIYQIKVRPFLRGQYLDLAEYINAVFIKCTYLNNTVNVYCSYKNDFCIKVH